MDLTTVGLFLLATFAGAVATGLSGFALGLVAAGVWLHILTPAQVAALIVFYGLPMQSYWLWRLRHALVWRRVMPFMLGGRLASLFIDVLCSLRFPFPTLLSLLPLSCTNGITSAISMG